MRKYAGVSHFYSRKYTGTRWTLENLDWACNGCHLYHLENDKNVGGWYHNFMVKKLGKKGLEKLSIMAYSVNRFTIDDLRLLYLSLSKTYADQMDD